MMFIVLLFCVGSVFGGINIVTNNPICTDIAGKYIQKYPNITTPELFIIASVCEGIVHPMDSGLGGGFQAVIHKQQTVKSWYVNSRERAGKHHDFPTQPGKTAKHIGVPSMLKGYAHLYLNLRDYGYTQGPVLSWHDLFRENIKLANNGFTMSRTLMNVINAINLAESPWRYNQKTQTLSSPILGAWLRRISNQKPKNISLYTANATDNVKLMSELNAIGSPLKRSDITGYKVHSTTANSISCLDYTIYTTKVPGSGSVHLLGCKILEYAIKHYNYTSWSSAKRFIFNIKILQYMQSLQPHLNHLVHKSHNSTESLIKQIIKRDSKYIAKFLYRYNLPLSLYPPMRMGKTKLSKTQINLTQKREERGTSNICIRDAVTTFCATSTINWGFGSCIASKAFGFFYNNQLSDFTYGNTHSYNKPTAGNQPLSSISPMIFTKTKTNKFEFALGAAGGRKIIPSIFTIMTRFIYEHERSKTHASTRVYNCERDQNIARCVFHIKPYKTKSYTFLECENSLHSVYRTTLSNYKALVKYSVEAGYSSVTVLTRDTGCYDPRRGGKFYK